MPDNKRNLSTTKLLNNTALNKEATTPKITYNKVKKEKEDISFIAEDNENKNNNINNKQNDSHATDSFIDEMFLEDNMEYLNDPLAENNFKSYIDEFKAVYNEAYISMYLKIFFFIDSFLLGFLFFIKLFLKIILSDYLKKKHFWVWNTKCLLIN